MIRSEMFGIWWFLSIVGQTTGFSCNQPKICPNASWNATASTFATSTLVGVNPWAVFVNPNNTVYAANRESGLIRVWSEGSIVPTRNISGNLSIPYSLFVTSASDIYIDNGEANYRVDKWSLNATSAVAAAYMCGGCYGLFIDINNNLYCSMYARHQVISKSLDSRLNVWSTVAGTGVAGATTLTISYPRGVLVDTNMNLYVADYDNDRIQWFPSGQLNGTTVVGGSAAATTISLYGPTALVFDADGYLFISDTWNHRIVGSGPNGFRCIMACSGAGSSASALYFPASLSFDSYGNLYVADWGNNRIQKFFLSNNSCGASTTTANPSTTAPATTSYSTVISYNQPTFSASAIWSGSAIAFANSSAIGGTPYGLFVDKDNTVYVADRANSRVQVWLEGSRAPTRTITGGLVYPYSVFATSNADVYVDNGYSNNRVDKWTVNGTNGTSVMPVRDDCYGLFIDVSNNLYCSMYNKHQVAMKSLSSNSSLWIIAAGTDCLGSTSNTLYNPRGIFVDTNLNLYVADCGNNRVQKFLSKQLNALTLAGSPTTITLNCPSGIVLDGNGYLFIVDSYNHRILTIGPNGFRCIVGCSAVAGSSSSQLNNPSDLKFDSYGNIFVTDRDNNRVQKFILMSNTTYPLSINQPNFCPSTTWYPDGITFANSSTVGVEPYGLFIDSSNTLYTANRQLSFIGIWYQGNTNPNLTLAGGLSQPLSLFVTLSGDMYVDNGGSNSRVDKWSISTNSSVPVMTVSAACYSIFVDISNTLYCSMTSNHRVAKKWLLDNGTTPTIAAGSGSTGSGPGMLYYPAGVFVDVNYNLYVADCGNNRIQRFPLGQMNAITVAGNSVAGTTTLSCPNAITFDANGYLFIGDNYNSRIIGSGPYGFRCIFGCGGVAGAGTQQLNYPRQFSFDTYGNFFVADQYNYRVQKFLLASNSCSLSYNRPKLCPDAVWSSNGSTVASSSVIGLSPFGVFIDGINNIYAPSRASNAVLVWSQWGTLSRNITGGSNRSLSVFVSIAGDVYFDDGFANGRVGKSLFNTSMTITVMNVNGSCYGLFIDLNNYLYCSLKDFHQVVKVLLNSGATIPTVVAGTGFAGSAPNMLNGQQGIYVDNYFNLYIADCGNNRIQLYQSGQVSGMTVAGSDAAGTISLSCPTGIVLDLDGYLFIVDSNNHRIVGSSWYGFRCLIGCSGGGSTSTQLSFPQSIAFDSYGNIYVTDRNNSRIQNFYLQKTDCSTPTTIQTTMVSTLSAAQTTSTPITSAAQTTSDTETTMSLTTRIVGTTVVSTTDTIPTSVTESIIQLQTDESMTTTEAWNRTCYPPVITLIPGQSTLKSPLQYRRSQDFSISSLIELNCDISLSTTAQWTIKNCTSTFCSFSVVLNQKVVTTSSELYIPSRTLAYGTYELTLTVIMTDTPTLQSSLVAYVRITATGVTANLVQLGTSTITRGSQQDLFLDPGTFSVDPDEDSFDAIKWKYEYYCRIYGPYNFPNIQGILLPISDSRIDPYNPSCLSNQSAVIYGNSTASPKSSLTIRAGSLRANQTYQFLAYMENRKNSSIQATGYVLVTVDPTLPKLIAIGCVISVMCVPNLEFQLVNPTTQVALYAVCIGLCLDIESIRWNIYQGSANSSSNSTKWTLFSPMTAYENSWFFGIPTTNFTATNQLFLSNPQISLWRFEVVYTFPAESSTSALNFIINQAPSNGSCLIDPPSGTTTTLFTVSCPDWFDADGINDYSLYAWTTNAPELEVLAFSVVSTFTVRLPAGDPQDSLLHMVVHVRDLQDCVREVNMSSIVVTVDSQGIENLIGSFQTSSSALNRNPLVRLLFSGNQNVVGQILASLAQEFNQMNSHNVDTAVASGIPAASISISPLGSSSLPSMPLNESALVAYTRALNSQANIRDYLMNFVTDLLITTINSIKLQSSSLVQMTGATNQLTRTAASLAADKCHQLAVALFSMARKVSFEDVQIASRQLTQCATNVVTAINGPLQARTVVLDLDLSRANAIPTDFDTDLESPWSDTRLKDLLIDSSGLSIEASRNIYYQKQTANEIATSVSQIHSLITSSLNIHLNLGQKFLINTSQTFLTLQTISVGSLGNQTIEQLGNARFQIPSNFTLNVTVNSSISLRSTMGPLASVGNSKVSSKTNLSTTISLSLFDQDGNEISFHTNSMRLVIPRDPNTVIPSMTLQNVTFVNSTIHNLLFHLHYINISSALPISVHIEMHPLNTTLSYLFIRKFDGTPQLNSSLNLIDGWTLFCPSNLTKDSLYLYFLDNQQTLNHQSLIFGLRELNSDETLQHCSANSPQKQLPITDESFKFTSDYELRLYTSGCYYLDSDNTYQSEGLLVGSLTNHYETECFSNHLTTFAGGFIVLPAPIDWSYVFANLDFAKNKTVYITVIVVTLFYLLLSIYARLHDKTDREKLGVIPLLDNQPTDQYFYQILVFTGQRVNAGTQSKVYLILSGEQNETAVRRLEGAHRKICERGGIDAFILAVPKPLGYLNYMHIWHDNSGAGSSASWFLKYIIVRDLQTSEKFYFIAQRWFAVEKEDGLIERVLPVANEIERHEFSYLLSKKTYNSVSDGHLWFSIFSHPPSNRFTRVQRCTCCFVLLFSSMLLNVMYYDLSAQARSSDKNQGNSLSIGPLYISAQQVGIGVMVELFSLIPSLLIVQFFRRIRPRQQNSASRQASTKAPLSFPWWCLFVAYILSFVIIILSIFFIIVRGIEFGDLKTQQWLTSIVTGFVSSILVTQPIKIVCLAIFFACFCRNSGDAEEENEYIDDEEVDRQTAQRDDLYTFRAEKRVNRLNEGEITYAREERLKEIQMWAIIQELVVYVIFFVLICLITFSNREPNHFEQVQHLRSYFLNSRQADYDYTQISTVDQYWQWLEVSFTGNIRAQVWYNGESPQNLNGFLNDKSNRLIGWATMRQLRIKSELCSDQRIASVCDHDYSLFNEERGSFAPGWSNETNDKYSSSIIRAFQYQSSENLDTYTYIGEHGIYSGNGYVYEFRGSLFNLKSNLSKLHQLAWIDGKTRAIFIQLTLYNPNVQLFTSVTLLSEFLSTGGVFPSARFEPLDFYVFTSLLQLICTLVYMILIIYFMLKEIRSFIRLKRNYFRQFWSLIDLGIIGCSWSSVGVYIWRYRESNRISQIFEQTNGYTYVNFQRTVYVNDLLTSLLGFCCFFGMIKFIHLCRVNSRLSLFIQTLSYAGKGLGSFLLMFAVVFMSFLSLFYLLFAAKIHSCSGLLETAQMLFEITLMKFNTNDLFGADAVLGPVCFAMFIFIVVFVCLSMFLSIINDSFRRARAQHSEGEEMLAFILKKFLRWTGLKKPSGTEIQEERDSRMRSQYFDPIQNFPDRIDQLLEVVTRIYINQKAELSRSRRYEI